MKKYKFVIENELYYIEAENIEKLLYIVQKSTKEVKFSECIQDNSLDNQSNISLCGIYPLKRITYKIHRKNGEESLKASYNFKTEVGWAWCSKYLCFNKPGFPRIKAREWVKGRVSPDCFKLIENTTDAYKASINFSMPKYIHVSINDAGYPYIVNEIWR